MSKTLTLVERLKSARDYLRTPKVTIVGPVQEIELRYALAAEDAISALEAAEKALEPFAGHANRLDADAGGPFPDTMRIDHSHADAPTAGDLRLARSAHELIKGT